MINIILTALATISITVSLLIIALVHIIVFAAPILFLYWCIPTGLEKLDDLIEGYRQRKANEKYKNMTKAQKKAQRNVNYIGKPYDPNARDKKERKQRKWDKKHPIRAKIRDTYNDFIRLVWYKVPDYPADLKRWIRFKYQRASRGWAVQDAWGFDWYLSRVIIEGCTWLKKNKHGIPMSAFDPSAPLDKYGDTTEPHEVALKRWDGILDKIIKTFKTSQKIQDSHWYYQKSENYSDSLASKWRRVNKKIKKGSYDLWKKRDLHVMTKKECKEYEEGWKLFQEHYFGLWD